MDNVEREEVSIQSKLLFKHDWQNRLYCIVRCNKKMYFKHLRNSYINITFFGTPISDTICK